MNAPVVKETICGVVVNGATCGNRYDVESYREGDSDDLCDCEVTSCSECKVVCHKCPARGCKSCFEECDGCEEWFCEAHRTKVIDVSRECDLFFYCEPCWKAEVSLK